MYQKARALNIHEFLPNNFNAPPPFYQKICSHQKTKSLLFTAAWNKKHTYIFVIISTSSFSQFIFDVGDYWLTDSLVQSNIAIAIIYSKIPQY